MIPVPVVALLALAVATPVCIVAWLQMRRQYRPRRRFDVSELPALENSRRGEMWWR